MKNNHWQKKIYEKNLQINEYPFSEVVSYFKRLKLSKKKKQIKILEIGCGCGNNLSFLAQQGFKVSGIDFSHKAIKIAKNVFRKKKLSADLVVGNIKKLNWSNEKFDYVFDRAALTHNSHTDIPIILDEVSRVLKKKGTFVSFDLFSINIPNKKNFKVLGLTSFFNLNGIKKMFSKFNLKRIEKKKIYNQKNKLIDETFFVEGIKK